MSKRIVTITMQVDATNYHETEDTDTGTVDLVLAMLCEVMQIFRNLYKLLVAAVSAKAMIT